MTTFYSLFIFHVLPWEDRARNSKINTNAWSYHFQSKLVHFVYSFIYCRIYLLHQFLTAFIKLSACEDKLICSQSFSNYLDKILHIFKTNKDICGICITEVKINYMNQLRKHINMLKCWVFNEYFWNLF